MVVIWVLVESKYILRPGSGDISVVSKSVLEMAELKKNN
jgi:hypothetical protein